MTQSFIPLSSPSITEREVEAVAQCLREGRIASTKENTREVREAMKHLTDGHDVLLTTSCTSAMELALSCLELQKGQEVVLPSFTFVSCATAILRNGGTPIFCEIEDQTCNIDLNAAEAALGSHTRAIMPVHYAGISCAMDRLLAIAKSHECIIIEDAAHALGAKYDGRALGTLGEFGCYSFHDTKNHTTGEGGALIINNEQWKQSAERRYEKGTNRASFLRGEIDKYTWVSLGSSYTLSGILAAILQIQIERHEEMLRSRQRICTCYRDGLARLVDEGWIRFGTIPPYSTPSEHIAFFLVSDPSLRDPLLQFLKENNIGATFHYIPLHLSPFAQEHLGTRKGMMPTTERIAESIVRLPLFPHLPLEHCNEIIEKVIHFFHPPRTAMESRVHAQATPSAADATDVLDLTLILPCYNELPHLHASFDEIICTLDRLPIQYEIILIDDGSTDGTPERIKEELTTHPNHRLRAVFHEKNQGRGATVTEGIRLAKGRYVGFIDIDLEVHARYIPAALLLLQQGRANMVLADRNYKTTFSSLTRWITTATYKWLVQRFLNIPPLDTEAGFKFFHRDAIFPVLQEVQDPHWFWDTEITVCSLDRGLRIHSLPVLFIRKPEKQSTVYLARDSLQQLCSLVKFWKRRRGTRSPHVTP
jgi:dTDP-4-amino-4,6-dideoxygalactose transaminase